MRLSIVYGAVATAAVAAHDARGDALDSMCVVTNDNSGMLYEMPCGLLPLHEKDNGGTRQMEEAGAKVKRQIVYETSKVVVIAIDQMISATNDKRPTTFSGTYATAHVERHDPFDGVAKDLPTFVLNIPTVLTKTFAAETIEMAVSTGEDDTLERFTIQPSTVTQTIPAQSASLTASAKAKRQEPVVSSVESGTTTTAFLFDPVATTLISVPTISQSVVSRTLCAQDLKGANNFTVRDRGSHNGNCHRGLWPCFAEYHRACVCHHNRYYYHSRHDPDRNNGH